MPLTEKDLIDGTLCKRTLCVHNTCDGCSTTNKIGRSCGRAAVRENMSDDCPWNCSYKIRNIPDACKFFELRDFYIPMCEGCAVRYKLPQGGLCFLGHVCSRFTKKKFLHWFSDELKLNCQKLRWK